VKGLSIEEQYIDINEEKNAIKPLQGDLNTYDFDAIKSMINQILNDLDLIYVLLDNRFETEKEALKKLISDYRYYKNVDTISESYLMYVSRIFELMLKLYDASCTNDVFRVKEKLENSTLIVYNESVINETYLAEFFYGLGKIDESINDYVRSIDKVCKSLTLLDDIQCIHTFEYYSFLFKIIKKLDSKEEYFNEAYDKFKNILDTSGTGSEYRDELKACLDQMVDVVISLEDIDKIDDLIIILDNIMERCGETGNVAFYLYDIYEELLRKQSYFKVMHCLIQGEGAQAKRLLIKKFKLDDMGIAKVISEKIDIAESTAYSYLSRSRVPSASFHSFIESTFECDYSEVIQSPEEQILEVTNAVSLNIQDYCDEIGFEKVEYIHKKSIELGDLHGEVFLLSCIAVIKFALKHKDCFECIDKAISKARKVDFELLTYSITRKALMLNFSGKSTDAVKLLENHRRKLKNEQVCIDCRGKFYYELGIGYRKIGNYQKAKKYVEIAYNDSVTIKVKAIRLNMMGLIMRNNGEVEDAMNCYFGVFEITSSKVEHAIAYNNMAYAYMQLKEYEQGFEMVEKAISLVSTDKLINRRIKYYDTFFELILLNSNNFDRFKVPFNSLLSDLFHLIDIYESFRDVTECVRKVAQIIIIFDDRIIMRKLLKALKEAVVLYKNTAIAKEVGFIFAETMISFIDCNMIEEGN